MYSITIYTHLGDAYIEVGENDLAIQMYEKALKIQPNNITTINKLAIAFHMKKDYDTAFKICKRVLDIDPDNNRILIHMAGLESHKQNTKNSLDLLKKFIENSGDLYSYSPEFNNCFNHLKDLKQYQNLLASKPNFKWDFFPFQRSLHK